MQIAAISQYLTLLLPVLRQRSCEAHPNAFFPCSSPVWLHHHLRRSVPAGSSPGSAQQHHWDSSRRLQVCHSVEETYACPSHWHRSVWSLTVLTLHLLSVSHTEAFIFFGSEPLFFQQHKFCGDQIFSIYGWRLLVAGCPVIKGRIHPETFRNASAVMNTLCVSDTELLCGFKMTFKRQI